MASQKRMIVVGGPNGAGKTTFIRGALKSRQSEYLGADIIAEELNPRCPESMAIQAGRMFIQRLDDRIQHGNDLIIESTLSGKSLIRRLQSASTAGFETVLMFVFLDSADTCMARVRQP